MNQNSSNNLQSSELSLFIMSVIMFIMSVIPTRLTCLFDSYLDCYSFSIHFPFVCVNS